MYITSITLHYAIMCYAVSPSLHANTSLSNTTSPVSSVTSSPSSSLDVSKSQRSTPVVQENKSIQKRKTVDSKKIVCDAIERIFCVDIQVSACMYRSIQTT